jgi:hypothetical protein
LIVYQNYSIALLFYGLISGSTRPKHIYNQMLKFLSTQIKGPYVLNKGKYSVLNPMPLHALKLTKGSSKKHHIVGPTCHVQLLFSLLCVCVVVIGGWVVTIKKKL